jgi:exodeoxyribonuclease-3
MAEKAALFGEDEVMIREKGDKNNMRLISWNVNGLRACLKKGFEDSVRSLDADIICVQETKMQEGQAEVDLPGYRQYFCSAEKKGYAGTAVFSRI